jgi:uncharacterized membrane protein YeaQ/YmgE (transglycosylase-associated protein family)
MGPLSWVIVGGFVGMLADVVAPGSQGWRTDAMTGIVGAVIGGILLNLLGASNTTDLSLLSILVSVVSAVVLLYIVEVMRHVKGF